MWFPLIFAGKYFVAYFMFRGHIRLLHSSVLRVTPEELNDEKRRERHLLTLLPPRLVLPRSPSACDSSPLVAST